MGARDIAFHLKVHFSNKAVVCNTYSHGKWGKEERTDSMTNFPFQRGATFDLVVLVEMGKFKVH